MILRPELLSKMKLGIHPKWTPQLSIPARAAASAVPPAAFSRDMLTPRINGFNSAYGDCVPTGCCNIAQTFLGRNGKHDRIPDTLALSIYGQVTGFDANDPATDQGTDPNDMFAWWKMNDIAGVHLNSVTLIDPRFYGTVQEVVSSTGFIGAVLALSIEQQNQIDWSAAGTPGTWGRHFVCMDQYDGPMGSTSWGEEKWIDYDMFAMGFVVQLYELDLCLS